MIIKTDIFGETEGTGPLEPQYHDAPFYSSLLECVSCACRAEATKVVPGVGPRSASIAFLGRNPGGDEDAIGQPFIGRGGKELDRMLDALDLDRLKVAIWNTCKCHTLGDRAPKPIEIETCTSLWLGKELEYYGNVSIIFPLGNEAVRTFLGPHAESTARREGYWTKIELDGRVFHICPLNHPGYLLRARAKQGQMYNSTLPAVKQHLKLHLSEAYERSRQ